MVIQPSLFVSDFFAPLYINNTIRQLDKCYNKLLKNLLYMLCKVGLGVMCLSCIAYAESPVVNLEIIKQIESSGNPEAFNSSDPDGGSRGLFQVSPILLRDFNVQTGSNYTLSELWSNQINQEIAEWYIRVRIRQFCKAYKKEYTVDNVLVAYNCGVACLNRNKSFRTLPRTTREYIAKYHALESSSLSKQKQNKSAVKAVKTTRGLYVKNSGVGRRKVK